MIEHLPEHVVGVYALGSNTEQQDVAGAFETRTKGGSRVLALVVSDGMSTQPHARQAAEAAVRGVRKGLDVITPDIGAKGLKRAHAKRLVDAAHVEAWREAQKLKAQIAATVTAVVVRKQKMVVAHAGDSLTYHARRNANGTWTVKQLTRPHNRVFDNVYDELSKAKASPEQPEEQAEAQRVDLAMNAYRTMDGSAALYSYAGGKQQGRVDVSEHALLPGDHVIVASDGLSVLTRQEIAAALRKAYAQGLNPNGVMTALVEQAVKRSKLLMNGDADNTTGLLYIHPDPNAQPPLHAQRELPKNRSRVTS